MTVEEQLEERRRALDESINFFSGENKSEREKWVCRQFLKGLGLQVVERQLVVPQDLAIDIAFRDARFQIKEMLDPGRRRSDEYRKERLLAEKASHPRELLETVDPIEMTPDQMLAELEGRLGGLSRKYAPDYRESADLLIYFNLTVWFKHGQTPGSSHLRSARFRSISLTTDSLSWVLWTSSNAPEFLRSRCGVICRAA